VVELAEVLAGELGGAVGRERRRNHVLRRRERLGLAVDRRRRRVDEPRARRAPGRLEQVLRGQHVVAQVGVEALAPARPDAGLGRQVVDGLAVHHQVVEVAPAQVDRDEVELTPLAGTLDVA
jgi:hypothetical protein